MWNWNRIKTAWGIYRHAAAAKGLLESIGVWKFVILGGSVLIAGIGTVLLGLPLVWAVLTCLVGISLLLLVCGLAIAVGRVGKTETTPPTEGTKEQSHAMKPHSLWTAAVIVVVTLGVIGWISDRNHKPSDTVITKSESPLAIDAPTRQEPQDTAKTDAPKSPLIPIKGRIPKTVEPKKADPNTPNPPGAGAINIAPGGIANSGTITGNPTVINNPLPPERTWEVSIGKCDEWVKKLDGLGPSTISIGAFISHNNGDRVVRILATCFGRSTWHAQMAVLPANPDGVEIGAAEAGPKIDTLEEGLRSLGLRVTKRDINPAYQEMYIVIGTDPINTSQRPK
jgi:hypothetical protein